ncbi:HigA family addiction module antitoxin [Flavisphingomonas formosensis]|uniref:HigA family addiction module antitoxin n=1 Tax=Flavisphingomonas formosensis TaxID=861534 RepID=UPI0012F8F5F3|nr:HigA family addiction module antitoxin [Sphingomonas formosensis]
MINPMTAGLPPTHPGEILREDILPAVGKPKAEIARLLGVSRQHLYDILGERKPITSQMALRLAKMFGTTPELWLRMQQAHDLRIDAAEMADELEKIPHLEAA